MRTFFSTLRFRITLLHVVVYGTTLLIFSAILYFIYHRNQAVDFDQSLYNRALGIARSISINLQGQLEINQALIAESGRLFPFQFGNEYIEIRSPEGRTLARSNNLGQYSFPLEPDLLGQLREGHLIYSTLFPPKENLPFWGNGNLRLLSLPLMAAGQPQVLLQLGVSMDAYDQSLNRLRTLLFFVGVPITLLLAGAGGWWLAGYAFQPINQIISSVQKLSAQHLKERLPIPEADDELRRLSTTLNEMLNRLENAFKSQQRFVADASHELKTPLTILQGELDVLRQQPRTSAEYQTFLASASDELQCLSQIIQNLLLLARADSGQPLDLKEGVRLDEVVLSAVERLQPFAEKSQVRLTIKIEDSTDKFESDNTGNKSWLVVHGDEDLLGSLFFNLLHNAIKHSSAGQTVETHLQPTLHGSRVSVKDFGTGIPTNDLPHIFERFYRAENPTRREVTGTGLGLAIAQWIAKAHGAQIIVESKPAEGSCFSVIFKK